ncbi:MAG: hypothetical protein GF308_16715, partial [Candidatus Heimdallarchaeota archaeon]|nr:hypothetical protein [Candidatus Heimdallarchaeota archaeon]
MLFFLCKELMIMNPEKERISELLEQLWQNGNYDEAIQQLKQISTEDSSIIWKVLQEVKDYQSRCKIVQALREIGLPNAVPQLVELIKKDKSDSVRREAAFVLGRIGTREAIQALLNLLKDSKNDKNQRNAQLALSKFGLKGAIPELITLFKIS